MFRQDFDLPGATHGQQVAAFSLRGLAVDVVGRFETQEEQGLDLLFTAPKERLEAKNVESAAQDFYQALDAALARHHCSVAHPDLPAAPGWVVLLSYELAQTTEPKLRQPASGTRLPLAYAVYCAAVVILDRARGKLTVLADDADEGAALADKLGQSLSAPPSPGEAVTGVLSDWQEDEPEQFLQAVAKAKDYISAGDLYQVNLSRRWQAQVPDDWPPARLAGPLHAALACANPAPFAAVLIGPDWALVSASPERLVSVHGALIQTRPIAGTHPRSPEPLADHALAARLRAHPKERAEHVMLVDLERNDLGKLCRAGTVIVDELLTVEHHPTVHHLVSNIRGQLKPQTSAGAVLKALFPGGTITGCPKLRAMQVIAELEATGRGAYTGSLGYITVDGRMDFNILIRSLLLEPGRVSFRAGAGIVADSDPTTELAETRAKARGLLRALGVLSD
jgi:anthranilate synthase component 1